MRDTLWDIASAVAGVLMLAMWAAIGSIVLALAVIIWRVALS